MKERECNKYTLYLGRSGGGAASIPSRDKGRKEYTKKKTNETHTHTEKNKISLSLLALFSPTSLTKRPPPSFVCVLLCGHTNKKEKKKKNLIN